MGVPGLRIDAVVGEGAGVVAVAVCADRGGGASRFDGGAGGAGWGFWPWRGGSDCGQISSAEKRRGSLRRGLSAVLLDGEFARGFEAGAVSSAGRRGVRACR